MSTILDDLDETDANIESLSQLLAAVTFCPECGHVDYPLETRRNFPCGTCGRNCDTRRSLFVSEERDLLQAIFEIYKSKHRRNCILLFIALMERHLRNLIISRLRRMNTEWQIIDLLIDQYWIFDQRVKLLKKLVGLPSGKFNDPKIQRIFDGCDSLKAKRNALAHALPGFTYKVANSDIRLAVLLAADSFSIFRLMHHKYCSVDSPGLPIN